MDIFILKRKQQLQDTFYQGYQDALYDIGVMMESETDNFVYKCICETLDERNISSLKFGMFNDEKGPSARYIPQRNTSIRKEYKIGMERVKNNPKFTQSERNKRVERARFAFK